MKNGIDMGEFSDSDSQDEINNDKQKQTTKNNGGLEISPDRKSIITTNSLQDFNTDSLSKLSSSKNRDLTLKIKQIEDILKERLSSNWVSVRTAFLDLDEDFDGFVTAENFAKLIGGSSGSS